jgi:hypothetical protein
MAVLFLGGVILIRLFSAFAEEDDSYNLDFFFSKIFNVSLSFCYTIQLHFNVFFVIIHSSCILALCGT